MLIDKKREEMYFNCRMRKKDIDKKMAVIRAILFIPPALILIGAVIDIAMSVLGDAAILATGAGLYGYEVMGTSPMYLLDIICSGALIAMALGVSFFGTEYLMQKSPYIYSGLVVLFFILLLVSGYVPMTIFALLAAIAIPLSIWNKKLAAEEREMRTLDGYPHFNPALIKHTDTPFVPATKDELDEMSAEDRIMYEREH